MVTPSRCDWRLLRGAAAAGGFSAWLWRGVVLRDALEPVVAPSQRWLSAIVAANSGNPAAGGLDYFLFCRSACILSWMSLHHEDCE